MEPRTSSFDDIHLRTVNVDLDQSVCFIIWIIGGRPYGIEHYHSGFRLPPNEGLNNLETNRRLRLGRGAFTQDRGITRLRFEGNDLGRLAQSSKCGGAPERKITIIRADIEETRDSAQCLFEPVI